MTLASLVALVVVVAAIVVVAVGAASFAVQRRRHRDNQVVPGRPTRAPAGWAGAHSPEARLHRRLRDGVRSLRAAPDVDGATVAVIEDHAAAIDDQLVAVALLDRGARAEPLAALAEQVTALEDSVAALVTGRTAGGAAATGPALRGLADQLDSIAAAHAELDGVDLTAGAGQASTTDLEALADRLDAERAARGTDPASAPEGAAPVTEASTSPPDEERGTPSA